MRMSIPKRRATRIEPGIFRAYWSTRGTADRSGAREHDRPRGPQANANRARRRRRMHARAALAHRLGVREAVLRAGHGPPAEELRRADVDGHRLPPRRAVT